MSNIYINFSSSEIASYIDWTPFFQTWELHGRYPKILDDEIVGEEAQKLFKDAQKMLQEAIDKNWLEVKVVFGFLDLIFLCKVFYLNFLQIYQEYFP